MYPSDSFLSWVYAVANLTIPAIRIKQAATLIIHLIYIHVGLYYKSICYDYDYDYDYDDDD